MFKTQFAVSLASLLLLVACGGGGGGGNKGTVAVVLTPSTPQTREAGRSLTISATVQNDSSGSGVTWSLTGAGTLGSASSTSVTYFAPASVTSNQTATVVATSVAQPTISSSLQITVTPSTSAANVVPLIVDGGPAPAHNYANGVFTSVTICVPGTSNCQTVDGILVDTGSFGLRVLKSALTITLTPLSDGSGGTINNCGQFVDLSFLWGQVAPADVSLGGETASNVSVQVIAGPTGFTVPTSCSSGGLDVGNLTALGANGILGVGPEGQDCGIACDPTGGQPSPPVPAYYSCASGVGCTPTFVNLAQQLTNPVVKFATDNNGVILEMQPVASVATTASGSLIFGIGTQSNNQLGGATIQTMDNSDSFTTVYKTQSLTGSFIDSGSNGFFFPDSSIPQCSLAQGFYCPTSSLNLSAVNHGLNSVQTTVDFTIDNAENLFSSNPSANAFSTLGGAGSAGSFDWGFPFFYGRSVFTSIRGQTMPSGTPAAPWWAY